MKAKNFTSVGALHPILFFAVMYFVVLVFSIFICSSLFYSCSASANTDTAQKTTVPAEHKASPVQASATVVLR